MKCTLVFGGTIVEDAVPAGMLGMAYSIQQRTLLWTKYVLFSVPKAIP